MNKATPIGGHILYKHVLIFKDSTLEFTSCYEDVSAAYLYYCIDNSCVPKCMSDYKTPEIYKRP